MATNRLLIRRTEKDDLKEVIRMIQELANFEEMPDGPKLTVQDLIRDGNFNGDSTGHPLFYSFIAEYDGKPVGYSIGFYTYSTWEGKAYLIEDIYIQPEYRKLGIGKALFIENVKFAKETNCSRFDFHVLNWNPAKGFYQKLGAQNLTEKEGWEFFRLTKSQMDDLLKN